MAEVQAYSEIQLVRLFQMIKLPKGHPTDTLSQVDDAYKGGGLGLRGRLTKATVGRNRSVQSQDGNGSDKDESTRESGTISPTPQVLMLSKEHKEVHK